MNNDKKLCSAVFVFVAVHLLFVTLYLFSSDIHISKLQLDEYFANRGQYQQSQHANEDIYDHIVNNYQLTLRSVVSEDESNVHQHTNFTNMLSYECKKHPRRLKCKFNANQTCTKSNALQLYQYPEFNQKELNKNERYKQHLETITNLKYLVIAGHGGTSIATMSYLTEILNIPPGNIANLCSGSYCEVVDKFTHYYDYFNQSLSRQFSIINHPKVLKECCWAKSHDYWRDINNIKRIHSMISAKFQGEPPYIDVIICTFPSSQCAFLMPFAKVFIIRFMHRFNHHVWTTGITKWGRVIHSMSHYCKNIILTASNPYDWYYTKHLLNVKADTFYLWSNFATHFIDEFGINNENIINKSVSSNNFIFSSLILTKDSLCYPLLNTSKLQSTLKNEHGINLWDNRDFYSRFIYDKKLLHSVVGGIIGLPHSVHGAKWIEYYSVGIQLFLPTLRFWIQLNDKCECIAHRNAGNKAHKSDISSHWNNYVKYSPCCGTNPFEQTYQNTWLQFSEYYMNEQFFKYVIFYDNLEDLIDKIVNYNKLDFSEKWKRKQLQMQEIISKSHRLQPHLVNALYNAYQQSDSKCNLEINELVKCLIERVDDF